MLIHVTNIADIVKILRYYRGYFVQRYLPKISWYFQNIEKIKSITKVQDIIINFSILLMKIIKKKQINILPFTLPSFPYFLPFLLLFSDFRFFSLHFSTFWFFITLFHFSFSGFAHKLLFHLLFFFLYSLYHYVFTISTKKE